MAKARERATGRKFGSKAASIGLAFVFAGWVGGELRPAHDPIRNSLAAESREASSPSHLRDDPAQQTPLVSAIAAREYWASETDRGLQAPNRKQNLRSYFDPTGVRVHDRIAEGSPRLLGLALSAIGRGNQLARVAVGEVSHHQVRVEIRRAGLVESFGNRAEGLEPGGLRSLLSSIFPIRAESTWSSRA